MTVAPKIRQRRLHSSKISGWYTRRTCSSTLAPRRLNCALCRLTKYLVQTLYIFLFFY
ncbi:hypothetical protein BDA96_03G365400 [Sorghum bicolor]|uniref:Uncharacterized protein n=1 Tax=Sorghum bicolor TaxID=4558 RepID=A0A921RGK0_SORBI|nr:hypothetical protein BDA96_03G365400 [Sorghum bicolor]